MLLAEFICSWAGNYTKEQEDTYKILHGDNREDWPPTQDQTPITIDLHRVVRFNPHHDRDKTTVEMAGAYSYSLVIEYNDFKKIMNSTCTIQSFIKSSDKN